MLNIGLDEPAKITAIALAYIYVTTYSFITGYMFNYGAIDGLFALELVDIVAIALSQSYYKAICISLFILFIIIQLEKRNFKLIFVVQMMAIFVVCILTYMKNGASSYDKMKNFLVSDPQPTVGYFFYLGLAIVGFLLTVRFIPLAKKYKFITALAFLCPAFVAIGIMGGKLDEEVIARIKLKDKAVILLRHPIILEKGVLGLNEKQQTVYLVKDNYTQVTLERVSKSKNPLKN